MNCNWIVVLGAVLAASEPRVAAAQPSRAEWIMERNQRERWMHGRQLARFTPFTTHRRVLHIDSIRAVGSQRQYFITSSRNAYGRDSALITADSEGHIVAYVAALAPYRNDGPRWPGDSAGTARFRRFRNMDLLDLVETRTWDLVPTFPVRPRRGVQWTDTIAREAAEGPYRQTVTGRRISRILRDSVLDGRRMWVVRDSADLRYIERYPDAERTLGAESQITRSVSGIERGVHLFDPTLGLYRWRYDTTALRGDAVLRMQDGRILQTAAVYERTRDWALRDSSGYARRVSELNAEMRRTRGGMVHVPNPVEARIQDGDTLVRDSLVRLWQSSADPNTADEAFRLLSMWGHQDTLFAQSLDRLRIAAGDSVFLYRQLARIAFSGVEPADSADVARMLGFMENPRIAWELNLSRDWLYENLVQALTTWPPAIADESGRLACRPAACRLLGVQWRSAKEQRTRDVGLVALWASDPARWAEHLLAQASPERPLLQSAASIARGVASNAPASARRPMPPLGSDTTAWYEWMAGEDPAYAAARRAMSQRLGRSDAERRLYFTDRHGVAIRMFAKQTGRDIAGELRRGYESAGSERERLVFATMLRGLGELRLTANMIAQEFRSGIPERARVARESLMDLFEREAQPMDSADAVPLVDRMVAVIVDNWPLWPAGAADMGPTSERPELHARRGHVRLAATNLPPQLVEKWGQKVDILTPSEQRQLDPRQAAVVYTVSPVTRVGPFARIEVQASERLARSSDEAPAHFASAVTYYLMKRDAEWVIVALSAWVT